MLCGYLWTVSREHQDLLEQQHQALVSAGVACDQIYEDLDCPRRQERPRLQNCLEALQTGDTLVVWRLDRLADSRAHLLEILQCLVERRAVLHVLTGKGTVIVPEHINPQQFLDSIEALSELEEQIVREATLEGLAAARERGQTLGAKRKMTAAMLRQVMTAMADPNITVTQIATSLGITRSTLYNYFRGDGSLKPAGLEILQASESSDASTSTSTDEDISSSSTNV